MILPVELLLLARFKILSLQDIMNKNQSEIIKKIKESDIENEFLQEWEKSYKKFFIY